MLKTDFEALTEQWGMRMPPEQVAMARTRYELARRHSSRRDVLEIACGSGFGLDYLVREARLVVGGDVTVANLRHARSHVPQAGLARLDAHNLPFGSRTFDAVVIFEAIYYFRAVELVFAECRRVLRIGGQLLLSLPNSEHRGFHASPQSVRYFTARELEEVLRQAGFVPSIYAAFPTIAAGGTGRMIAALTNVANGLHLIPKSLNGRARIKRLVYGRLTPFGGLRKSDVSPSPLIPVVLARAAGDFRNLYAVADAP